MLYIFQLFHSLTSSCQQKQISAYKTTCALAPLKRTYLSSKQPAIYHRNVTPTSSSWRKNKKTQTGPGIRVCIFNAGPPQRISSPLGLSLCSGCSFAPPCNRTHRGHFRYNLYENRGFMPARSSCFVYLPRARAEGSLKFPDRNKLKFLSVCPPKRIKASKQPTTSTTTTDCLLLEAGAQRAHLLFYSYESCLMGRVRDGSGSILIRFIRSRRSLHVCFGTSFACILAKKS